MKLSTDNCLMFNQDHNFTETHFNRKHNSSSALADEKSRDTLTINNFDSTQKNKLFQNDQKKMKYAKSVLEKKSRKAYFKKTFIFQQINHCLI